MEVVVVVSMVVMEVVVSMEVALVGRTKWLSLDS